MGRKTNLEDTRTLCGVTLGHQRPYTYEENPSIERQEVSAQGQKKVQHDRTNFLPALLSSAYRYDR